MTRTVAVLVPRWPITAAGIAQDEPAAVFHANRVVVASLAAEHWGIVPGMRRREAQARCPEVVVLERDEALDARAFEPVVAAVEAFAPRVEVVRPGLCVLAARGPSRYFGGEEALCRQIERSVADTPSGASGHPPQNGVRENNVRAGVADGVFVAEVAARTGTMVPPGRSREFLAPFPVDVLDVPDLVDVLLRLGIRTLGDLAALPTKDVVARFGADGEWAHRMARGDDDRPLAPREPPPDLVVARELDPPAENIDIATFTAKNAADELSERLSTLGLGCAKLRIEAQTEHGEQLQRVWRYSSAFTPTAIAERVRWQLEGWLLTPEPPTGGIALLRLVPEDTGPIGTPVGLWGRADVTDAVRRALHRVQGLLGHDGVLQPVLSGGRHPSEQATLVPWGDPVTPARAGPPGTQHVQGPVTVETPPWPGRLPSPSPALLRSTPVELRDANGNTVGVTGRFQLTARPARLNATDVTGWAGPWPTDERWWHAHRRRARLQVVLADGTAHLLALEAGRWSVEATYD